MKHFLLVIALIFLLASNICFARTTLNWGIRSDLVYFKKSAQLFKSEVEKKTSGRVLINLVEYPESDEEKQLATESIASGKYQIGQELTTKLTSKSTQMELWNLPFLFKNDKQLESFFTGALGQKHLESLETVELLPVNYSFSGGFLIIYGQEIKSINDLSEKELTIEEKSDSYSHMLMTHKIKAVKNDVELNYNELITAVADELIRKNDINKKFINITNHRVITRVVFVDKKSLLKMSAPDRKTVLDSLKKHIDLERKLSVEGRYLMLKVLENRGAIINNWTEKQKVDGRNYFKKAFSDFMIKNGDLVKQIDKL